VAVREKITRLLQRQSDVRRLPPILILGETGTGKGLLARAIHRAGPRGSGPFVDVNCAAIPETLLEAELFGFERGAFTDARQAKAGLFQAAHGGTIFLDEVGLLPEGLQAKLLTVIENRAVRRLGSTRSEPVDAWILTATNQDLLTATRERRFREDLYHRLAVLSLSVPPLRERGRDILVLAEHFLARACDDYDLPPKAFTPEARATLLACPWPGNIRELSNVIERVVLLSEAPLVTTEMLGLPEAPTAEPREVTQGENAMPLEDAVGGVERAHLLQALRETGWNITRAAVRLGISRNTLRYRIDKHGLRQGASAPALSRRATRQAAPVAAAPAVLSGAAPAPASVRWERRRLTLLRAALVVPPDTESPLYASRALEVLAEKVQSFGGRIDELSPTGIVAAYGLEPVEDAPRRAAHTAMAIRKAAERARRGETEPLAFKLGIHVGQFLVGQGSGAAQIDLDAKHQAWVVLEALVSGAQPNAIVVSQSAAPLLERHFDLAPLGALERAQGQAYRLAGRERRGFGLGRRMTRFVGRRQDLELVRTRLASAMRGHGQAVGILGEAGIGKSRLLFEFRQSLAGQPVPYLRGRCLSYGSSVPYLPLVGVLRRNFRIPETDPPEAITEKVRSGLQAVEMDPEEWAPYLLQLLGVKEGTERLAVLSPEAIKERTFETLRQILLKASRRRPMIVVVEDLQWIDKTSEDCIASLVGSLAGTPILFLSTYRPGYRPPWLEKSYATQMALQPLSPQDALSVVHSVLPTDHVLDPLVQLILDKAEGNPFFLEELSRALREQGDLRPTLAAPDTIQEVLLARIDRLPEEAKRLLQTASILGREISLRLLEAIWEGPGALDPPLRELMRLEFLYEQSGAAETVYLFKHALTQEVAYASLPEPRRRTLHAAAGRALEATYADRPEEAYDRLAYHYSKTQEADKAVDYLSRFAKNAARLYAHEEAVTALQEALMHVNGLPAEGRDRRLFDLILSQGSSLIPLGRFQEILDLLLPQRERLERLEDASLTGHYYFLLGWTYTFLGDHDRAAHSAQRAISEAERCGDEATKGKAYCLLAQNCALSGRALQGIEYGLQAVKLLELTEERWWLGHAHWNAGQSYTQIGQFEPALEALARAQAVAEAMGDPRLQSFAAWVSGVIHAAMGEWEAGVSACQRSFERSPDPFNRAITMGWLGFTYLEKGDVAHAIPLLEQAAQRLGQFGFRQFQGWFAVFLADAYRVNRQIERALDLAIQGLEISRGANFWVGVGWARQTLGRIAQARGELPEAESHFNQALQTFASTQSRYELGRTRMELALLARARGNQEAAATHLREAHQLFTALRIPKYVERTEQLAKDFGVPLSP
ncbi:MAG: sigma 54-interacting transcriptional regulator, partial [Candidatus Methylomirabilia bacterium]